MVGRPSQVSGSDREDLPDIRERSEAHHKWSGGFTKCPRMVGGPAGFPGVVVSPCRVSGRGREPITGGGEAFPDVREWSEALTDVRE